MTPPFTPVDLLLLAVIALGLPLRAWLAMRRLRAAAPGEVPALRPGLWARAVVTQWLIVGALVVHWLVERRSFGSLSLNGHVSWGAGGIVLGLALMALVQQPQRRNLAATPDVVARIRTRLEGVERLLPSTRAEWPRFVPLALTAGICEEILFRGFVTWALAQVLPQYWQAALLQAVLFGLAHVYQGARGVFLTGMVGAFMAGVVWVSGSLWPAMLAHALLDLNAGDLAIRVAALPRARPPERP
jgi:membrane protease YdiL (CAAX protease family)